LIHLEIKVLLEIELYAYFAEVKPVYKKRGSEMSRGYGRMSMVAARAISSVGLLPLATVFVPIFSYLNCP
jgi:hypothetical protein